MFLRDDDVSGFGNGFEIAKDVIKTGIRGGLGPVRHIGDPVFTKKDIVVRKGGLTPEMHSARTPRFLNTPVISKPFFEIVQIFSRFQIMLISDFVHSLQRSLSSFATTLSIRKGLQDEIRNSVSCMKAYLYK
jgi:hypothetical protein